MKDKKVYLKTLGCQMNIRDSEAVKGLLLAQGYSFVEDGEDADVILFNTCSVRQHAEGRVWSAIGEYRGKKEEGRGKKKAILGIIGCMAESHKERIFERAPGVNIVCGPGHIDKLPNMIKEAAGSQRQGLTAAGRVTSKNHKVMATGEEKRPEAIYHTGFHEGKDHAYVVISEGCENFCSYCVVPYTRGALKHRDPDDILNEVRETVAGGITALTLLGQNVNSYSGGGGQEAGKMEEGRRKKEERRRKRPVCRTGREEISFVDLLREVSHIEGLKSLSFITSHPKDVSPELFELMAKTPVIKKYLHLPVQSGSDRILGLMGRSYSAQKYLDIVDCYRSLVYNGSLSTDLIVGFPTETEEDFEKTVALCRNVRFDSAYIFKYSPRPHTRAAQMKDDVSEAAKKRRHAALLKIQKEISRDKKIC